MDEPDKAPELPESSGQPPQPQAPTPTKTNASATVEDAIAATREFATEHMSLAFGIFGLYAALTLIGTMLGIVVSFATGVADLQIQQMNMSPAEAGDPAVALEMFRKMLPMMGISMVYGIVANGFYAATFRPAREAMLGESSPGFGVAVGQVGRAFGKGVAAVIVLGIIVGLGFMMCILPSIIAYFFLIPYFYLVCGKGEGVVDGVGTSFEWAKNNVGIVISIFAVQFVFLLGSGCIQSGVSRPILESMGKTGLFVTSGISWVAMTVAMLPVWLFVVGSMSAIERASSHGSERASELRRVFE